MKMKLEPKVITGALTAQNKGACDWGWQGQVAHGCYSYVVVIDPKSVQVLQVLDKHKGTVVKVKWARENYQHDVGSPYSLRLASGDSVGSIIIWDVAQGEAKTEFSDGSKPIQDMEWLPCQDASHDLLVALHPPYCLVLWNADTGTRLWKKSYTEVLLSLSLDPFNYKNIAFLGQDCIVFIDDFSITKTPSSNGKKFYISSPSAAKNDSSTTGSLERKSSSSSSRNLAKRMTKMLVGDVKPSGSEDNIALNECIQLTYHHSCRHHIILLYAREILILDLEINQTVGLIPLERTGSPFLQVIPMQQRDVLFCLHENGGITCRVRRKTNLLTIPSPEGTGAFDDSPPSVSYDVTYDLRCQSDSLRMTRHCRVSGIMCCPVSENSLALLLSDSRVIFWDLHSIDFRASSSHNNISPLHTPGNSLSAESNQNPDLKIAATGSSTQKLPITSSVTYPKLVLCDMIGQSQILSPDYETAMRGHGVVMKFLMTGLLNGISAQVTVIRMCPPLTTKNWNLYQPLLAVGNQTGLVQIVHLGSGQIDREYSLHSSAVRGIEWANLRSFISFSYPKPGVSALVKNEILLVDISSGKATPIRSHKDQESPIEMLRISHLKQYLIITFKEKPLELWDMKTMTMLREMGKNVPRPTALEWSPSHSMKAMMKRLQLQMLQQQQQQQTDSQQTGTSSTEEGNQTGTSAISQADSMTTSTVSMSESSTSEPSPTTKLTVKEHFVYTDVEGTMYHFVVEGNVFTDASKIPPESGIGTITWVAWKGDYLAFGDGDGQLCLWDLKAKTSRINSTHRGWIKKIRFAPGRGNLKFLIMYNDGVDVWDINEGKPELISSLKSPKEVAKVIDAEWAGSDRPVLATIEGCLHMYDVNMKKSNSVIAERHLPDKVFSPYLMAPRASLLMKHHLQHQPWAPGYSLTLAGLREEDRHLERAINKQLALIDSDLAAYLPHCRFGTAQRCLMTARLFGDESEVHFWTVALHYLRSERVLPMSKSDSRVFSHKDKGDMFIPPTPSYKEANDLVNLDTQDDIDERLLLWQQFKDQPLEMCHDFLCDNQSFKKYQLDRLALHDSKRVTYEHTRKVVENYTMLGQTDRAVQLLLETEPDNDGYFIDCLRACLVASVRSSGASQSTIKLVATNLIANGKLIAGVQLLCLIDKAMDACRYLQTYGAWDLAVWLAKSALNYSECQEVMKRWVDHLSSTKVNQKSTAVLVMLSLGSFVKAIEMLYGLRQFNRAACFIEAAMEFGLLERNEETRSIIDAVFLEYARLLSNLGHKNAAVYYCQQAGVKGEQLLKEVEILFP